jgi:uncharacterized SAM-binding protein YcdF (DUF218 family)
MVITIYAGIGTAFAWFWICAGLGFLLLAVVIRFMGRNEIKITGIWRILMLSAISIGLCVFIFIEGTLIYYSNRKAEDNVDYLIVLGAQVRGTTISKSLKKRLDTALEYLKDNPGTRVIVSGGQGPGEDISEAEAMESYLLTNGVEENRIIKEDKSTNTNENILFSKKLIPSDNASIAIVTNGFHIFRSLSIAKKQGLSRVGGLAAPSDPLLLLNYYIREAAGILKDFAFGNI